MIVMGSFGKEIKELFYVMMLSFVVVLFLTGIAIAKPDDSTVVDDIAVEEVNDPFETMNRGIFKFNRVMSNYVLDPVVDTYKVITPDPVERSISSFFSNLGEPFTFVNSLFQGDWENSKTSVLRFGLNTTVGVLGFFDVATDAGLEKRSEDFGQVMAVHDVNAGPYIVLPLLGSSNIRDASGTILQAVVNPLPTELTVAGQVVAYSDVNDDVNLMLETSMDPYILAREAYQKTRQQQIYNIADDALSLDADAPG